jgi:hypothetical protein
MITPVYIRHKVGWCPICEAPMLDVGWTDDPDGWIHSWPWYAPHYRPRDPKQPHNLSFGPCAMMLSR